MAKYMGPAEGSSWVTTRFINVGDQIANGAGATKRITSYSRVVRKDTGGGTWITFYLENGETLAGGAATKFHRIPATPDPEKPTTKVEDAPTDEALTTDTINQEEAKGPQLRLVEPAEENTMTTPKTTANHVAGPGRANKVAKARKAKVEASRARGRAARSPREVAEQAVAETVARAKAAAAGEKAPARRKLTGEEQLAVIKELVEAGYTRARMYPELRRRGIAASASWVDPMVQAVAGTATPNRTKTERSARVTGEQRKRAS